MNSSVPPHELGRVHHELVDDVLVCPDLLTESERATLIAALRMARTPGPGASPVAREHGVRTELPCALGLPLWAPSVAATVTRVRDRVIAMMRETFASQSSLWPDFTLMSEMRPGDRHVLHADAERLVSGQTWEPNHTYWRSHVALVYLNTSGIDYDGGILRLPDINREVRPVAGMLLAFPSGRRHVHEVTTVETGARRSLAVWFTSDAERAERWGSHGSSPRSSAGR